MFKNVKEFGKTWTLCNRNFRNAVEVESIGWFSRNWLKVELNNISKIGSSVLLVKEIGETGKRNVSSLWFSDFWGFGRSGGLINVLSWHICFRVYKI
jgi:hypothetical protein